MNTSKIPIQNIYYLLCYAWNRLEERDIVDVSGIDTTSLVDLFAKILIAGLQHIFKQGMDRGYILYAEDTRTLRGKFSFIPTIKRNLLIKAQIHCEYDELSYDILHNQIIKATIRQLINVDSISQELKSELIGLYRRLHEIRDIFLSGQLFNRVQLNRNNSFYTFLIGVCEIIYENLLVSEKPGKSKFRDFFRDQKKMAHLFEEFIRNFYKLEAPSYHVGREDILWDAIYLDETSAKFLPKMTTDISITSKTSKVVIDTKYYQEAMSVHFDQEKIHSQHLFQLFSYLKNLETKGGSNKSCSGMLLYPTVDHDINYNYILQGHRVMIRSINLNQHWENIHKDLIEILETGMDH